MVQTFTCPVLAFTPEVDHVLSWFYATHELTNADGRVWWRRTALPQAGGVGDQDCQLMEELEYFQALTNGLIALKQSRRVKKQEPT